MTIVDRIESEKLRDIYRYWQSKCRDGTLPRRKDIDPTEIPELLPYVVLVDVIEGGRDFRYRLLGTHVVDSVGFEFTGQLVSEFMRGREGVLRAEDYHMVIERRAPRHGGGDLIGSGRDLMHCERLLCPLSGDGETIDMIFGGMVLRRDRDQS